MGLIYDSMALSRAGFTKLSSSLTMVDLMKNEKECTFFTIIFFLNSVFHGHIVLVWQGIANGVSGAQGVWWEYKDITDKLDEFRRVS